MSRIVSIDLIEKRAIASHAQTNHFYDDYLPYEFHLRMVVTNGRKHMPVLSEICRYYGTVSFDAWPVLKDVAPVNMVADHVIGGHWYHDGIEDVRLTFNDIVKATSLRDTPHQKDPLIGLIAIACTSDPHGLNREERMPDHVYERIRMTPGATATKLNDRCANIQYGILTGSTMPRKYKKENDNFLKKLSGTREFEICAPIVDDLLELITKVK